MVEETCSRSPKISYEIELSVKFLTLNMIVDMHNPQLLDV